MVIPHYVLMLFTIPPLLTLGYTIELNTDPQIMFLLSLVVILSISGVQYCLIDLVADKEKKIHKILAVLPHSIPLLYVIDEMIITLFYSLLSFILLFILSMRLTSIGIYLEIFATLVLIFTLAQPATASPLLLLSSRLNNVKIASVLASAIASLTPILVAIFATKIDLLVYSS